MPRGLSSGGVAGGCCHPGRASSPLRSGHRRASSRHTPPHVARARELTGTGARPSPGAGSSGLPSRLRSLPCEMMSDSAADSAELSRRSEIKVSGRLSGKRRFRQPVPRSWTLSQCSGSAWPGCMTSNDATTRLFMVRRRATVRFREKGSRSGACSASEPKASFLWGQPAGSFAVYRRVGPSSGEGLRSVQWDSAGQARLSGSGEGRGGTVGGTTASRVASFLRCGRDPGSFVCALTLGLCLVGFLLSAG